MLWAYFDESGQLADSDFICLCGYIAGDSETSSWDRFSDEWGGNLRREGLPFIHTSSLFARREPYDGLGWNDVKVNDVLTALSRPVSRHVAAGFGVALDARHYRDLAKDRRELIGDRAPDLFLFHRLMKLVIGTLETWNYSNPIALTFDWTEGFAERCLKPLATLARNREEVRRRISSISFANDEQYFPLQAADMLCFGIKRALEGTKEPFFVALTEGDANLPPVHYATEYWDAAAIDQHYLALRGAVVPASPAPAFPRKKK